MKRYPLVLISVVLACTTCATKKHRVPRPKPPTKKLVVLEERAGGPAARPYLINGERYYPLSKSQGFVQFGKASWYGKKFHGRPTSSGEIYDMYQMTAAHKTLPLGTYVRAKNLTNKKHVIVKINDRGPFVKGRIIDLSYGAAKRIGMIGPGVAPVKIVALGREVGKVKTPVGMKPVLEISDMKMGQFTIQVGAFKNKRNALKLADRLKVIFKYVEVPVYEDRDRGTLYRVRVSRSRTLEEAAKKEKRLVDMGFKGAFIVSL
jgi:rare lipoprotein A